MHAFIDITLIAQQPRLLDDLARQQRDAETSSSIGKLRHVNTPYAVLQLLYIVLD
jgi:hypothetical protein